MIQVVGHAEWGAWDKYIVNGNGYTPLTTKPHTGTYSYRTLSYINNWSNYIGIYPPNPQDEFYFQFWYYYDDSGAFTATPAFCGWLGGSGAVLGGVNINHTTDLFQLYTGNFASLVDTSAVTFVRQAWACYEVYMKIADSGRIEVRRDGSMILEYDGDTKPGADTTVAQLRISHPGSNFKPCYCDDILVIDTSNADGLGNTTWPNGQCIVVCDVTGDSTPKQWSSQPSGTHYTCIDEKPNSYVDYTFALSADLVDTFTLSNLPSAAASVRQVQYEVYAIKSTTDAPTQLKLGLSGAGGINYCSALAVPMGYDSLTVQKCSASYTPAQVDAAVLCIKSVS